MADEPIDRIAYRKSVEELQSRLTERVDAWLEQEPKTRSAAELWADQMEERFNEREPSWKSRPGAQLHQDRQLPRRRDRNRER